jgi:hypothetical protein
MRNIALSILIAFLAAGCAGRTASPSDSSGSIRRLYQYDSFGGYAGHLEPRKGGGYYTYDALGGYTGHLEPRKGGGYYSYDALGGYSGALKPR